MARLRIVLADDHGVLRAGLRALLDSQPDLQVVGEAETADAAVKLVGQTHPDLALVDVRMPGGGLLAAEKMKQVWPTIKVLILSQYADPAYLERALAVGASGYALKQAGGDELLAAIDAVARGEIYLHPTMARLLSDGGGTPHRHGGQPAHHSLSERELQVLRLMALGHTLRQVADRLGVSPRTVEVHKQHLVEKLGLYGRAAFVRYALEHGLLTGGQEFSDGAGEADLVRLDGTGCGFSTTR